nr:MAG TPA: hypothetical protein [Caudoviricetes sp.]
MRSAQTGCNRLVPHQQGQQFSAWLWWSLASLAAEGTGA